MELNRYQELAQRTSNNSLLSSKIENGIFGLFGEGGECADIYKKYVFQGHDFEREHMIEELGDVLWYAAELAAGLRVTLDEVAKRNVDKLRKRYPDGFDPERSVHRDAGA